MNFLAKKGGLTGLLLLNACAHYPAQYGYYPDSGFYGGGYSVTQRNYYDGTPNFYYYKGYDSGREYFRPHRRDQHHDYRSWNHDSPAPRQQHYAGENRHGQDAYQSRRQEYSKQKRNDYAGHPEPRHQKHMINRDGRQVEQHVENHNRWPHQEDRDMHKHADEPGKSDRGWSNRQFDQHVEKQNRRPLHQEGRGIHNRADGQGGESDRDRANRWRNSKDHGMTDPAAKARPLHSKNAMSQAHE